MPQSPVEAGTQAVVLAAGGARRFGGGKLSAPFRGKPLLIWAVEAALATRVEAVTVVVGADSDRLADLLSTMESERLRIVTCPDWQEGLSRSLRCGLASLPPEPRAVLLFLGDMPLVSSSLADRLLETVLNGAPAAMPVGNGQPGHPVAIAGRLLPALHQLTGDRGARALLAATPGAVSICTDDPGSLFDVDTRADLAGHDAGGPAGRP